jgi:predicted phosphoribosyltransferase
MLFRDREDAGRRLAEELTRYRDEDPLVLALPRGGVVVGYEVARALDAPLDIIVARKLGAPHQPELGIGAIAPGDVRVLDEMAIQLLGISKAQIEQTVAEERREMERRLQCYRGDRPLPDLGGRTVILVDDGLATGVTARAAIQAIRRQAPRRLVLAVPVCPPETAETLRPLVDDLMALSTPPDFHAVGLWYGTFAQTSDDEVIALLQQVWGDDGKV